MSKPPALNQTREQITALDKALLGLLSKRRQLSLDVARSKEVDVRPIRDVQREKELLERLVQQGREQGLDAHYVISLYQSIIEDSVLNQQAYLHGRANPETQSAQYNIAYLGARGSYSYLAASRYCDRRQVEMVDFGCKSFDDIISAVESGHADYGFLPIENTSSGSINEVYDVLQHTSLAIVGETTIEVGHCLLVKPGTNLTDVKTVYAHPQPVSQCSRYLSQHQDFNLQYCSSSAEAMSKVIASQEDDVAAIGSAEGGALYELHAIEHDLANQKVNQSRFIVVARKAVDVPAQLPAKTTLIMATGHKPGALVEALLVLKNHNVNMSKLESRPIPGTPWEEMFYLDIDGNLANTNVQHAIQELEKQTRFIKVLGCYPCETVKPTQLSQAQLLIEPNSSKSAAMTSMPAKHSRDFKAQNTELALPHFILKHEQFSLIKHLPLPSVITEVASIAKHAKEAGVSAIALCQLGNLTDEHALKACVGAINHAGLSCLLYLEDANQLTAFATLADAIILAGNTMYDNNLLTQAGSLSIPVFIERHSNAPIGDWLNAADSLLNQGNQQIGLIDAGISQASDSARVLDLNGLIDVRQRCHLPIIVDTTLTATQDTLINQSIAIKKLQLNGAIINPIADDEMHTTHAILA